MTRTVVLLLLLLPSRAFPQTAPVLDIRLELNMASAERTLELLERPGGSTREAALLPGSRLALAAVRALSGRALREADLMAALDDARFGAVSDDDPFGLEEARRNAPALRELVTMIARRNFARRVTETVAGFFPQDARIRTRVPVHIVAFGPLTIDAFVQRIIWRDGEPLFAEDGELTIVLNLTRQAGEGGSVEERFLASLATVAHEVFHAAFGVYQDSSDVWRSYRSERGGYLEDLLELTHNEGIAHYLSFEQRGGYAPRDWERRVRAAVAEFNSRGEELLSPRLSRARAGEILRTSNTSTYWESFGALTGLHIARTIDRTLGRPALAVTIARGPVAFFLEYAGLCDRDSNLPRLSPALLTALRR